MIEGREIVAARGVIATGPAEAARVGGRVFEMGGNAMDAAAAACLACAVLEPQGCDLGGYVAAGVVLDGATGRVWSLDSNSVAPSAASESMYEVLPAAPGKRGINELEYGCSVRDDANVYGPLSVGVPGFLAGVGTLCERWGRLPWAEVVAPAIGVEPDFEAIRRDVEKKREPMARFGSLIEDRHELLRKTLARVASAGWRDFYSGELGARIADFVHGSGGILSREDMASFDPRVTEALSCAFRGVPVYTAIAPNGGFSVIEALRLMPSSPDWDAMVGVLKRMWRARLGGPAGASPHGTIHVASADAAGNLVSMTISQGGLFGSCMAVPGTGVILGHGMCRFDPHAGLDNSPGPRKRPLNNVCPMIVRMPDRDVAIGARGGRKIVSVVTQFVQRIVDDGATAYEAAVAPRIHVIDGPVEVSKNFDPAIRAQLKFETVVPDEVAGAAHGAEILKDGRLRAGGNTWAVGV